MNFSVFLGQVKIIFNNFNYKQDIYISLFAIVIFLSHNSKNRYILFENLLTDKIFSNITVSEKQKFNSRKYNLKGPKPSIESKVLNSWLWTLARRVTWTSTDGGPFKRIDAQTESWPKQSGSCCHKIQDRGKSKSDKISKNRATIKKWGIEYFPFLILFSTYNSHSRFILLKMLILGWARGW